MCVVLVRGQACEAEDGSVLARAVHVFAAQCRLPSALVCEGAVDPELLDEVEEVPPCPVPRAPRAPCPPCPVPRAPCPYPA